MKLAVITRLPPTKFPEAEYGLRLCQELARDDMEIHILSDRQCAVMSSPGISIHPRMDKWSWGEWPRLWRFLKQVAPDVVLLSYLGAFYHQHPMITYAPTLIKSLLPNARIVTQISAPFGSNSWLFPCWTRLIRRLASYLAGPGAETGFGSLLLGSDDIIVFSEPHRMTLVESYPSVAQKIVIIPPAPFLRMSADAHDAHRREVLQEYEFGDSDFVIGYFGYIYQGKGLETLFHAVRELSQRGRQSRLLIIGGMPEVWNEAVTSYSAYLQELAAELDLNSQLRWLGHFPWDSDIGSRHLYALDVCVLPFDRGLKASNSSFSTAAVHGVPIISTRGDMVERAFIDEENVLLCPPKDPYALAAAIERVMDDHTLRQRLRAGSRRLAREHFSWDRVTSQTGAVLRAN